VDVASPHLSGSGYDRERGTRSYPGSWESDGGERRQRGTVDQTEHDKREADCPQTGGTTWVAAHDRDPHRIVEATRKNDIDQRRAGYQPLAQPERAARDT
jgi:hypothetical protein